MTAPTLTAADIDRWQSITTPDGLKIEGSPRHGFHVSRDQVVLASYYHGPESSDVLAALDRYRRDAVEARRAAASE